jgi:DNA (cytosine-5)-methyltransferase 1
MLDLVTKAINTEPLEAIRLNRNYRVLDLFAGIGGLSYGFELIGAEDASSAFEIACAVEKDKQACETLRENFVRRGLASDVVLEADITEPGTHQKIIEKCKGQIDIIIGGPPCQSFSSIGARSAALSVREKWLEDDRDELYLEYASLVKELKPAFLVFENVRGILTKRDAEGNRYIDLVTDAIKECGYELNFDQHDQEYVVLNAANYGVPQYRERVFVIANRLGITNPVPRVTHSRNGEEAGTLPFVTLWDAIGDLPEVKPHITMNGLTNKEKDRIKLLNNERFRGGEKTTYHWGRYLNHWHDLSKQGKDFQDFIKPRQMDAYLTAHVARGQQLSDIRLFELMRPGTTSKNIFAGTDQESLQMQKLIKYDMGSFLDKYRKHIWESPCTTVFAHMQRDGNRFIHPDSRQARTFTVREAARIQSFPDDFVFSAPGNVRYKHIGNAVPPLLAKAIAEAIYEALQSVEEICPVGNVG